MKFTPRARSTRLAILGIKTARCEKCLGDCKDTLGEWALTGLCTKCQGKPK